MEKKGNGDMTNIEDAIVVETPDGYIEFSDFIEQYSQAYLLPEDKKLNTKIRGIAYQQSCKFAEQKSLNGDVTKYSDFARMMAWKLGRIRHRDSQYEEKGIQYYSGWTECTYCNPRLYNDDLDLMRFHKNLDFRKIQDLSDVGDYGTAIKEIAAVRVKGIGIVYEIAVLFFISKGRYPIYDRFVYTALKSLFCNKGQMPIRGDSRKYLNIDVLAEYGNYKKKMDYLAKKINCNNYLEDRRLDRALWVYGHGFKISEKSLLI